MNKLNNGKKLRYMNDDNPLHHNGGKWRHQIVNIVKVVSDPALGF